MTNDPSLVLKAIASPVRMQILQELGFHGGRARVTDLADSLGLAPNSVSYHLRELAKAKVVEKIATPEGRDARETWYAIPKGGIALDFDAVDTAVPLPGLVDSLYGAMADSAVVARYRRAAIEAEDVPNERLIGNMDIVRLTPEQQDEFYSAIRHLVAKVSHASARNQEALCTGNVSAEKTQQFYFNLDVFPVVTLPGEDGQNS